MKNLLEKERLIVRTIRFPDEIRDYFDLRGIRMSTVIRDSLDMEITLEEVKKYDEIYREFGVPKSIRLTDKDVAKLKQEAFILDTQIRGKTIGYTSLLRYKIIKYFHEENMEYDIDYGKIEQLREQLGELK